MRACPSGRTSSSLGWRATLTTPVVISACRRTAWWKSAARLRYSEFKYPAASCRRQRDEFLFIAGHNVKTRPLPIFLGRFNALLGRRHEIPPDMARAIHRLAAQHHETRITLRRERDGITGTENQK